MSCSGTDFKKKNLFFYELTDFRVIKINKISTDLTYGLKRQKNITELCQPDGDTREKPLLDK